MSGQKRPFRFGGQVVGIAGRTGDAQAVGYPPGPLDGGSQADAVTLGNVDGSNAPSVRTAALIPSRNGRDRARVLACSSFVTSYNAEAATHRTAGRKPSNVLFKTGIQTGI